MRNKTSIFRFYSVLIGYLPCLTLYSKKKEKKEKKNQLMTLLPFILSIDILQVSNFSLIW